jgi:biotin operon repressor
VNIEGLWGLTTAQKLVWFYIWTKGEAIYSTRAISLALELSMATANTAVQQLKKRGLLVEIEAGSGAKAPKLRAIIPQ